MVRTYEELGDAEKMQAQEKCLLKLLTAITDGAIRFDDAFNDEALQGRIDAIFDRAERLQTPWFAAEMLCEDKWLKEKLGAMALADAQEAMYVSGNVTIIRL